MDMHFKKQRQGKGVCEGRVERGERVKAVVNNHVLALAMLPGVKKKDKRKRRVWEGRGGGGEEEASTSEWVLVVN